MGLDTDTAPPDPEIWHLADTIVTAFTSNPQNAVLDEAGREALRLSVYNALAACAAKGMQSFADPSTERPDPKPEGRRAGW